MTFSDIFHCSIIIELIVDPSSASEDEVFGKDDQADEKYTYPMSSSPSDGLPEPRDLRYSIMSDRTLSMYGSSEIFDANQVSLSC